jgi:hypothetical protein
LDPISVEDTLQRSILFVYSVVLESLLFGFEVAGRLIEVCEVSLLIKLGLFIGQGAQNSFEEFGIEAILCSVVVDDGGSLQRGAVVDKSKIHVYEPVDVVVPDV